MATPRRPERVTITHGDSAEFMTCQFNPDEVKEVLKANYNAIEIAGMPHKELQWVSTDNLRISCELGFDGLSTEGAGRFLTSGAVGIEDARRFLHGFFYPPSGAESIAGGAPSSLLLSWPGLYATECKLVELEITLKRFAWSMAPTLFSAAIKLDVVSVLRRSRDDMLAYGTRTAQAGG